MFLLFFMCLWSFTNRWQTKFDNFSTPHEYVINIFLITGPLCGEFTDHQWIRLTKASDTELWCFLWSAPWINGWVNNHEAGDLGRHRPHYDVFVMRWQNSRIAVIAVTLVVAVVSLFPNEINIQHTWFGTQHVCIHIHRRSCWWSPEKPKAHLAGNESQIIFIHQFLTDEAYKHQWASWIMTCCIYIYIYIYMYIYTYM